MVGSRLGKEICGQQSAEGRGCVDADCASIDAASKKTVPAQAARTAIVARARGADFSLAVSSCASSQCEGV